ncbi:ATP-binding protein [Isoptericola sp. NEAU-Y5]|uniref:ATP-binding protein n=1 Tax=Isoptericola luteus TaxID=2879484 RepID=A0ABS7ZB45_9MICO|nr:ATP-binding protein [Isoptericola sp. NEAU-Y5]MCA5892262.1 ATP-binding protein [Isoptericola sp. NEAU-Y5]
MTPVEGAPVGRLDLVGSWTVRSVDELADVRAGLDSRLPCHCPAAQVGPSDDVGGLTGRQRMVLVASELVANALEHARPPVVARLLCDGRVAVLDVVDRSPEAPPVVPHDREPGQGGHGLRIARRVADQVGWYRTDHGEKHVWAQFAAPVPAPAAGPARLVSSGAPRSRGYRGM